MRLPAKPRPKTCVECGEGFESTGKRMICSDECGRVRNARKTREKREPSKRDYGSKKCVVCNKKFKLVKVNQKTCSKECSIEWGREKARKYTRTYMKKKRPPLPDSMECPQCKVKFKPNHGSRRFCSDDCTHKAYIERKKANKPIPIVNCQVCGIEFEQDHGGRKYCSEKCAYDVVLQQQKAWRLLHRHNEKVEVDTEVLYWDDGSNDNYWLDEEYRKKQKRSNLAALLL